MSTSAERMRRLRARQVAGLAPAPDRTPRDPADLLTPAVETTITALNLDAKDTALAQLARLFAAAIDEAENPGSALRWLGPPFLKVLLQLGATPAARSAKSGKPDQPRRVNRVAQIRGARVAADAKRRSS